MMMKTEFENNDVRPHVKVLRDQLLARQQKNPRFSLRAYASMLDLHPSALSRILNGKQEISVKSCITVLQKLRIEETQRREFISSLVNEKTEKLLEQLSGSNQAVQI